MSGVKNHYTNDNGTFKSDSQLAYEADMREYHKQLKNDPGYTTFLNKLEKEQDYENRHNEDK